MFVLGGFGLGALGLRCLGPPAPSAAGSGDREEWTPPPATPAPAVIADAVSYGRTPEEPIAQAAPLPAAAGSQPEAAHAAPATADAPAVPVAS